MEQSSSEDKAKLVVHTSDLISLLWVKRWLMLTVVVVVTSIFLGYATSVTPIYKATIHVKPPSPLEVSNSNYGRVGQPGIPLYNREYIFKIFLEKMQGEAKDLSQPMAGKYEKGSYRNVAIVVSKNDPEKYDVMFETDHKATLSDELEQFLKNAESAAIQDINVTVDQELKNSIKAVEQSIDGSRVNAKKDREDRIVQLREALEVARSAKLEKPVGAKSSAGTGPSQEARRLYLNGTRLLAGEIASLQARKSDDPFISNLRALQAQSSLLKSFVNVPLKLNVYSIEGNVESTDKPIRPKFALYLVLGLLAGCVLALFIGVSSISIDMRKKCSQ